MSCCCRCCDCYDDEYNDPSRSEVISYLSECDEAERMAILTEAVERANREPDPLTEISRSFIDDDFVFDKVFPKPANMDDTLMWRGHKRLAGEIDLEEFVAKLREGHWDDGEKEAMRAEGRIDVELENADKRHGWMEKLHLAKEAMRKKKGK